MLIDESKQEVMQRKHPFKRGDVVECIRATPTTKQGNEYTVMNVFRYIHRCNSYEDHWFDRYDFIVIRNDNGFTIKVNAINFKIKQ